MRSTQEFTHEHPGSFIKFPLFFILRNSYFVAVVFFITGILFQNKYIVEFIIDILGKATSYSLNHQFRFIGFGMTGAGLVLFGCILSLYKMSGDEKSILPKSSFLRITLVIIILFYWNTIWQIGVNMPITDDYYTVLNFLNTYIHIDNVRQSWNMIFSPYVETRNVVTKFLVIGSWHVLGFVNFKFFLTIINIGVCGIAWLISKEAFKIDKTGFIIIPVCLMIFQFAFYDAQVWTTAGIHIVLTMFFAFMALYCLNKNGKMFFSWAIFFSLLATFTYGNGLLVLPIGLFMIWLKGNRIKLVIWAMFFLFVVLVYFYGYHSGSSAFSWHTFHFVPYVGYCLAFWGSAFQFMYHLGLPLLAGFLLVFAFIWLTIKKYYRLNPFIYGILLYIGGSAMMAGFFRLTADNGIQQALSNRYVIYSCIAVCVTILALVEWSKSSWKKNGFMSWFLVFSSCYYLLSGFFFYPEAVIRKEKLKHFLFEFNGNYQITYSPPVIPFGADTIVRQAIKNTIFYP